MTLHCADSLSVNWIKRIVVYELGSSLAVRYGVGPIIIGPFQILLHHIAATFYQLSTFHKLMTRVTRA